MQIDILQWLVMERMASTGPARETTEGEMALKLTRFSENYNIEAYVITFEQMMRVYEVSRARWVYELAPQLASKAQQASAAMPRETSDDYD